MLRLGNCTCCAFLQKLTTAGFHFQISLDENADLKVGYLPFVKLNEGWHTILLEILDIGTFASVDNGEKILVFEHPISSTVDAKLVLGDPRRDCKTFIGCIKDLVCTI